MNLSAGLTFVEVLIWTAVFTLAMGAMVVSLLSFYRTNTYTVEQAQAVSHSRKAIEGAVATMREAAYASDGAYPIISMATSSFSFYADVDDDPLVEKVRYVVTGTEIKRGVVEPSGDPPGYTGAETVSTITENIRNIEQGADVFTYYDEDGAEMTDLTDITAVRFVEINVVVNVSPDKLPNELTLRSSATLRNLR